MYIHTKTHLSKTSRPYVLTLYAITSLQETSPSTLPSPSTTGMPRMSCFDNTLLTPQHATPRHDTPRDATHNQAGTKNTKTKTNTKTNTKRTSQVRQSAGGKTAPRKTQQSGRGAGAGARWTIQRGLFARARFPQTRLSLETVSSSERVEWFGRGGYDRSVACIGRNGKGLLHATAAGTQPDQLHYK